MLDTMDGKPYPVPVSFLAHQALWSDQHVVGVRLDVQRPERAISVSGRRLRPSVARPHVLHALVLLHTQDLMSTPSS